MKSKSDKMSNSKQSHELKPAELNRIAREATSRGYAKALKVNISVIYTEKNTLVERHPDGKKVKLAGLKREKLTLTNKFKLK
jgi:hypothetical protein